MCSFINETAIFIIVLGEIEREREREIERARERNKERGRER